MLKAQRMCSIAAESHPPETAATTESPFLSMASVLKNSRARFSSGSSSVAVLKDVFSVLKGVFSVLGVGFCVLIGLPQWYKTWYGGRPKA